MADKGMGERGVLDLQLGRSETWPHTQSLVSQSTNTPRTPTLHSVLCPEQNTKASDSVFLKRVPVPSVPCAE